MINSKPRLTDIIEELSTLLSFKEFGIVNMILSRVIKNLPTMPSEKIIAYIRTTFAAKDDLPGWYTLVTSAKEEFKNRKIDFEKLLQGLI